MPSDHEAPPSGDSGEVVVPPGVRPAGQSLTQRRGNRRRALARWVALAIGSVSGHAAVPAPEPAVPVPVIFDTDMGGDCDDVGALFLLHGAVARGEARLVATMGCVSADAIAPALDAINTWFGRPDIPVGTLKDPGLLPGPHYTAELAARYPRRHASGRDYPDAVTLYRRLLAEEPDAGVVIVAVGPLRNIANLLKSAPDRISPLDGSALVARKVRRLDVMGGTWPPSESRTEAEYNFKLDAASAAFVSAEWPTAVLFNGEGGSTMSGRRVTFEMPEHNPLTLAYRLFPDVGHAGDRLSWDPVSCLVTVRGAAPFYKVVSGGRNAVDPVTGINAWQEDAAGRHSYLVRNRDLPMAAVEQALEDLMVAGRPRPVGLVFDTATWATAGMCRITGSPSVDGAPPIRAFDLDDRTAWVAASASGWLECRHVDGRTCLVTSYAVVCPDTARRPRFLELSGSRDDGATWTVLDTQREVVFDGTSGRREFTVAAPAKWNALRLRVAAADGQDGPAIATLALNEAITVRPGAAVAAVGLDRTRVSLAVLGRITLNATLSPLDAAEREVVWTSSDPSVAEVRRIGEQTAVVAGLKPGRCTIRATAGTVTQRCEMTVEPGTLPDAWRFDELNAPAIPGAVVVAGDVFTVTGCGHGMTSFWERVRDQGVLASVAVDGSVTLTARLAALGPSVGGPGHQWDPRPPSSAGLMIREALTESCGRFRLIHVDSGGMLVCRWRDRTGDQDDNRKKELGRVTLPVHLKLEHDAGETKLFASADGNDWGAPRMVLPGRFDAGSRAGFVVCSGNTFATTTAVFEAVRVAP